MRNELKVKLKAELEKEITTEPQVVYILSRVRKILEVNKEKGFKVLKFYCDWALHSEIEKVEAVKEILEVIFAGRDEPQVDFLQFNPLHADLKKFFEKYSLPTKICDRGEQKNKFNALLSQIYTDTPLIIITKSKKIRKRKLTWKGTITGTISYGGHFDLEETINETTEE